MKVLVTDPIADVDLDQLHEAGYEIETAYDIEGDALLEAVSDASGLIVRSGIRVTAEVFEAAPDLVIIGCAGVGVDSIDIDTTTQHGVIVASTPEGNVHAAVEHTVAVGFAAARSVPQAHARLRDGKWAKSDYLSNEINGKIFDVVGLDRVGQGVAKKFSLLGIGIVAYDPYIGEERADQLNAGLVEFDTRLSRIDFLTVRTPPTPKAEGLISTGKLEMMGSGYLISCARGSIVNEAILVEVVDANVIDGAAVDAFADEPVPSDNPFLSVDDVVITPHFGTSTSAAWGNVAVLMVDQTVAALRDGPIINTLNVPSADESAFPHIQPYIGLAGTAGRITVQLLDGHLNEVEVTHTNDIAAEDIELVTIFAPKGVFVPLERQVDAVNAPQVAEKRGIEAIESKSCQSDGFQSLVAVTIRSDDEEMTVSGTLFTGEDLHIVRINDYRLDAIPYDQMLAVRNYDRPGVIGFIGTVLDENDVNAAGMFSARCAEAGGEALTAHNLDDDVLEGAHEKFLANAHVIDVDLITF